MATIKKPIIRERAVNPEAPKYVEILRDPRKTKYTKTPDKAIAIATQRYTQ